MSEAIEATTYGWFNGTGTNGNASFGTEDDNLVVTFDDASVLEIEDIKGFFNGKKAAEEGAVVKFALSDSPEEDREALATVLFKNGVTVDGYDYVAEEDKAVAVDPDIINAKKNVSLVFGTKVMAEEDFIAAWDESDEKAGKVKMLMALARDISGKPVYDEAKAREIVEKDNYGILGVFFERKAESLAESRISKEYKDVVNDLWKEYDAKIASLTKEERFAAKDKFRSFIVKEYDVSKLNEYKSDFDAFYAEVQKTEFKNSAFDDKFVLPRLSLLTSKEKRSADISDYSEEKDRIRVPSSEDFKNWGNEGTYYHFDTKNKWLEYRAAERGMTSPYTFIDIVDDRERKCGYAPFATDVGREEVLGKACDGLTVYFDGHPVASKNKSRDRNFLISKGGYNSDGIFLKREVKVFAQDFDFEMALSILGKEVSENDINHFNLKVKKDEHLLMYLKAIAALNGQRDESDQITFEIVNPEQRHLFDEHKDELDKIKAANRAIYAANKAKEQALLGERDGRFDEIDEEAAARAKLINDTIDALKAHGLSVDDYKTLTDAKVGDYLMLLALADKDARTAVLAAAAGGKLDEYVADAAVADKLATYGDLLTNEESVRKAYNTAIEGLDAALAAAKDREAEAKAVEDAVAALKGISADDKELVADYRDLAEKGAAKGLMLHALLGGKDVRADMLAASDLKDYASAHTDDIAKADKLLQNLNVKIAYTDATALLNKAVEAAKARELLIAEAIDKLEKSDITVDEYISLSEVSTNSAIFLSLTDKTFRKELIDAVNNGDRGNYLKSKEDELVAAENLLDSEDRVFKAFSAKINSLEAAKAEKEAEAKRIAAEDKRFSDNLEANGLTVADMFNNLEKEIEKAKRIAAADKRFSDNLEANGLAVADMFNNLEKEIEKAKRIAAADKRFSDNLEANGLAVAGMFENFENKMQAINEVLTALNSSNITVENYVKLKEIADGYSDINRDAFMLIGISDEEALNDILDQGWDNYKETRPGAYEFAEELLNESEVQSALDSKIASLEDELAESLKPRTRQELDQIRREEIRRTRESGISTQTGIREVQPVVIQENRNLTVSFTHINNELVVIINPNTKTRDHRPQPGVRFNPEEGLIAYNNLAERINAGGSQFSCRAKFASVEEEQKFISTLTDMVINEAKGKVVDDPAAERVVIRQQPAVSVQNDLKNVSNGLTKTLDLSDEDILNILNKQELNTLRADKDFNKAVLVVIVNTKDPEKGKRAKDVMLEKGIAGFRKADRGAYNKAVKRYEDKDVQQLIDEIIFRIDEQGDVERIGPAPSNEQDLFVERKKEVLTVLNSSNITVENYVKLKEIADGYSDINRDAFMLIGISDEEALNDILDQGWDNYKETRPGAYEFAEELLNETEVQNALNSKIASLDAEIGRIGPAPVNVEEPDKPVPTGIKEVESVTLKENKNLRVRFTRDEMADELVVIINPNTKTRDRRPQPGVRFNPEEGLIAYNNLAEKINAGGSQFSCRAKFASVEEEQKFISTLTDIVINEAKGKVVDDPAAERFVIRQQPAVSVQNDLKNVSNGLTKTLDLSDEDILNILNKQELNTLRADKDFNKAVLVAIVNTKDPEKGKRAKDVMLEKGISGFRKADRGAYNKAVKRYEDKDVQQLIDEIIFRIDEQGDVERIGPAPSNEQDLFVERKKEVLTVLNSSNITVENYVKLKEIADGYSDINRDAFMLIGISDEEALNDILDQGWDNYKETRPGAYEFAEELLNETEVQNALDSKIASLEDELAESLKPRSRQELDQMRREEMKKAKESENSTQVENSTQIDAKDVELVTLKENKNLRVRFTRDERVDELVVIINPNTKTRDRRPQPGVRFNPEEGLIAYNNLAKRINAGGSQFSCRAKFVSVEEEQTFISTLTDMVEKQAKGTVTGLPTENAERIGPAKAGKETVEQMAKVREESERNAESLDLVKEVEVAEKAAAAREETISKMAQVQQNANALKSVSDAKVAAAKEARIAKTNTVMENNFEISAAAFTELFGENKYDTKEISSDDELEVSVTSGLFGTRGRVVKSAIGWSEEAINAKLSGVFGEICKDKNLFREGAFADEFSKIINGYTNAEGQHVDGYTDRFGKNLSAIMSTATKAVDHRVLVALNLHETGAWEDLIAQVSENTGIDTNQGDEITEQVKDAEKMFYNYLVNPKGVGPTEMKPVSLSYVTQSVNKTISGAAFKMVEQYPETQEYFEGWVSDTKKTGVASVKSYAGQNKKDDFEAFTKPAELMCYIATQEDEEAKKLREGIKKVLVAEKSSLSK